MRSSGFGRFEVLVILTVLIIAFCVGGYMILNGTDNQKFNTMKENALSFSKAVTTNISSFHYSNVVYLQEAVDEEIFPVIKNPFGGGNCDSTQSRVDTVEGQAYATLRCGSYLIDHSSFEDKSKVEIYEVSDWSTTKPKGDDVEEITLYNCSEGDELLLDHDAEELYFVYEYNKKYDTDYYFAENIPGGLCEITSKTYYRTHKKVD